MQSYCSNPCNLLYLTVQSSSREYNAVGQSITFKYAITNISDRSLAGSLKIFSSVFDLAHTEHVDVEQGQQIVFHRTLIISQSHLDYPQVNVVTGLLLDDDNVSNTETVMLRRTHL